MRTYGQYCPIARASEVLAERWTPIILRNLLNGTTTFTELADGAPGLSRTLLTSRLRELERVGVVETTPHPMGRGFLYGLTEAGKDLHGVMAAMGKWGERWLELAPEHVDPGMVLHSWIKWYLIHELLPDEGVSISHESDPSHDGRWMFVTDERGGGVVPQAPHASRASTIPSATAVSTSSTSEIRRISSTRRSRTARRRSGSVLRSFPRPLSAPCTSSNTLRGNNDSSSPTTRKE
ncbi:MAG: transcriptional regulator [Actinobacteria bacterium]|nr:transcriptional regulator [Actinomycetota bacterium]